MVQGAPPTVTTMLLLSRGKERSGNPVPESVTSVPPAVEPLLGETEVTVG